jgi:hypothetical protein
LEFRIWLIILIYPKSGCPTLYKIQIKFIALVGTVEVRTLKVKSIDIDTTDVTVCKCIYLGFPVKKSGVTITPLSFSIELHRSPPKSGRSYGIRKVKKSSVLNFKFKTLPIIS